MKLFKTAEQYLDYYYDKYKTNFRTQCWNQNGPQPWCDYKSPEWDSYIKEYEFVNNRERFPDEIVLDIDVDSEDLPVSEQTLRARKVTDELCNRLRNKNYEFVAWASGGKGYHIHVFFSELLKYSKGQRDYLKKLFIKDLGPDFLDATEDKAHICSGKAILIQLEQAVHRKGGRKNLYTWNETKDANKLPNNVLTLFQNRTIEFKKQSNVNLFVDAPKAIKFLEEEDFSNLKDGRARALFVLTCYYSHFMTQEQLFKHLEKWNYYQLKNYFHSGTLKTTIKGVFKRDPKTQPLFPYNYLKDLLEELGTPIDYDDVVFNP